MIRDRWNKPAPWAWSQKGVARDCRWALPGLVVAWPFWGKGDHAFITTTDRRISRNPVTPNHGDLDSTAGSPFSTPLLSWGANRRGSTIASPGRTSAQSTLSVMCPMVGFPTGPMTLVVTYRKTSGATTDAALFGNKNVLAPAHASAFEVVIPWTSQGWSAAMDYGGVSGGGR